MSVTAQAPAQSLAKNTLLSTAIFLIQVSRPGLWTTTILFYLIPLGRSLQIHNAVEEKAQRKDDIEEAEPEGGVVDLERAAERYEVEENGGGPEAGAGDLNEKFGGGKKSVFGERLGGSLGGYAHRRE